MVRISFVVSCALLFAAGGCTQSFRPDMSTETGNPPVIDSRKIALVVTQDEVHVRGEAGAITPPEADVEITIVRTDDVTLDEVAADGSFDVEVDATLDDVFEVRAVLGDLRSEVVVVDRGGAMVVGGNGGSSGMGGSGGMGGSLSCEEQESLGLAELEEALATADRSCDVDADCMGFYRSAACFPQCFGGFFSEQGLQSLRETVQGIDDGVCSTFEEMGCELIVPPCVPPSEGSCIAGRCEEGSPNACGACLPAEITWRVADTGVFPAEPSPDVYTLSDCNSLQRANDTGACSVPVPQCPTSAGFAAIEELLPLLETEEVLQARAAGGNHGEGPLSGGFAYEITIAGDTFTFVTCADVMGVECQPPGAIDALIELLTRMSSQNACEVAGSTSCTLPFDDGNCDAAIPVWWHDPESGACVRQIYGGCGGNGNRYATSAECEAACPAPVTQGDCPAGRQLREVCTECGLGGGCRATSNVCALECMSDSDCMGELDGFGSQSFCDLTDGVCEQSLICI